MKLDIKLTTLTILLWVILLPTFSLIHEVGHGLVCDFYGFEPKYHLTLIQNAVTCTGNFSDNPGSQGSFRMAGGFLAATIALMAFALLKPIITPKTRFIAIVLVVIGVTQFFNMTMETFAHDFYIEQSSVMTMVNTLGAMVMLFFLIQRHSDQTRIQEHEILHKEFVPYPTRERTEQQEEKEIPKSVFQRSIVDIIKGKKPKKTTQTYVEPEPTFASLDLLKDEEEEDEEGDEED